MNGIPRRDLLIAGATTSALALSGCSTEGSTQGAVKPWSRVHFKSGTEPWTCVPISGRQVDPVGGPYKRSVDDVGNLRFTSAAANTETSRREVWVTGDPVRDVEARVVIEPPSAMDPAVVTPQMGIALRVSDAKGGKRAAFMFDTNIFSGVYWETWCALWEWNESVSPTNGAGSKASKALPRVPYRLPIRQAQRIAKNPNIDVLAVDPSPLGVPRFQNGDVVDVVGTLDPSYTQRAARIRAVDNWEYGTVAGPVLVLASAPHTEASPRALETGYVQFADPGGKAADPRSLYPMHVAARVIGNVAQLKTWPDGEAEPTWSTPYQSVTVDFSHVTDTTIPESGQVGLIVNHLHGAGQYVAYGDLEVTPL